MLMVLKSVVQHLNQAKAEGATDSSEKCAKKIEVGTPADDTNEEGANTSTTSGEISIGSATSVSNDNIDSGSMAFSRGEADAGDSESITVASGNAQQQAGSIAMASSRTIM